MEDTRSQFSFNSLQCTTNRGMGRCQNDLHLLVVLLVTDRRTDTVPLQNRGHDTSFTCYVVADMDLVK